MTLGRFTRPATAALGLLMACAHPAEPAAAPGATRARPRRPVLANARSPRSVLSKDLPGTRVTVVAVAPLAAEARKGAVDGLVIAVLLDPTSGDARFPPAFGGVRLVHTGVRFNAVVNSTSSRPLGPDLIVFSAADWRSDHPDLSRSVLRSAAERALVAEYFVRGDHPVPGGPVQIELEYGIWPPGTDPASGQPTWQWWVFEPTEL